LCQTSSQCPIVDAQQRTIAIADFCGALCGQSGDR
jgi:hypothetical protein